MTLRRSHTLWTQAPTRRLPSNPREFPCPDNFMQRLHNTALSHYASISVSID
jgi:hypothetical protein